MVRSLRPPLWLIGVLAVLLAGMSLLRDSELDPEGHYDALGLARGTPRLVSPEQAQEAFATVDGRLAEELRAGGCASTGPGSDGGDVDPELARHDPCVGLRVQRARAHRAVDVLGSEKSKSLYDRVSSYNIGERNYYSDLGIQKTDDLKTARRSYRSLNLRLISRAHALKCAWAKKVKQPGPEEEEGGGAEENEKEKGEDEDSRGGEPIAQMSCEELESRRERLYNAAMVLGDSASRALWEDQTHGTVSTGSLAFVSSPLKMMEKDGSILSWAGPLVVVFAVLYYVKHIEPNRYIDEVQRRDGDERKGEGEGEGSAVRAGEDGTAAVSEERKTGLRGPYGARGPGMRNRGDRKRNPGD